MKLGMSLPVTVDGLWDPLDTLEQWARAIDEGPFASTTIGGRVAGDSPDIGALLGAVAAWTSRVEIVAAITPQLYDAVLLAKSLATVDRLSQGRLTVALGVSARDDDYRALGVDLRTQNVHQLADRARTMRWVWRGDHLTDTVRPVGPRPVRDSGPLLLMSLFGPHAVRSGAAWADGVQHVIESPDEPCLAELAEIFDLARASWADAGRPAPQLRTSFWFALDETAPAGARQQIEDHVRDYVDWANPGYVEETGRVAGYAGDAAGLVDALRRFEDLGVDEVNLIPTSADPAQVGIVAEIAGKLLG
ncbi:MAG TPA: LLM class flavin-dependent oxidoreductase [Nocardioides sp.]|uniref:LLM class flavin-dependent oxidoreductase n=1 Tax=Nocardioides sp. TaxID=35761 RepID=UPI002B6F776F|nr:LLM class flavin-dependent oxidoreductase [Nocardioides sp.]HTW17488.1 LLM class flavin-dependent oxidoreductase [Nocardioides sp.]